MNQNVLAVPLIVMNKLGSVQAQSAEERNGALKAPPADIRRYLKPTGLMEMRYIRMLSSLCNETYYLSKLSVGIPALPFCLVACLQFYYCAAVLGQHSST